MKQSTVGSFPAVLFNNRKQKEKPKREDFMKAAIIGAGNSEHGAPE